MSETPRIILEFVGGSEDGSVWEGAHALGYYWQAHGGRVGARFRVIPDYTFRHQLCITDDDRVFAKHLCEVYEVIGRSEEWDHVYVRAIYLGRESSVQIDGPE